MEKLTELQQILGIEFKQLDLLGVAVTHRSYLNENKRSVDSHNERLEFLGDAVLELIVTEYLYLNYSEPEGVLTNWRSALVKTESLNMVAKKLAIERFIRLSRGEARGSQRARRQILANSVEAIIGAIYLDQGYESAKTFIFKNIVSTLPNIIKEGTWQDPKTKLQELIQELEGFTPVYKVLTEVGPDHDKMFTIGVYINEELRGQGSGSSKQLAQQDAARNALKEYPTKN
jgi:ribonuclease-3